jgi:hypothetical protein
MQAALAWWQHHADDVDALRTGLTAPNADAPSDGLVSLADAVAVIHWYEHFICVKFMRAVGGLLDGPDEVEDEIQNDANGSAKIALIGVERSLAAWSVMYDLLGRNDDTIVDLLAQLSRVRALADEAFPRARDFIRPGFDEGACDEGPHTAE